MSKIGVELKIDVTKIDKNLLFKGAKGTYLDATVFIDINQKDQYDNNGMITQKVPQGGDKNSGAILGNCKVFWSDEQSQGHQQPQQAAQPQANSVDAFDDGLDIPF